MQIYNINNGSGVIYSVTKTNKSFFALLGVIFSTGDLHLLWADTSASLLEIFTFCGLILWYLYWRSSPSVG